MRALLTLLALVPLPTLAAGPTGLLNDTGVTTCLQGSSLVACTSGNTGDAASYPRQDARFGRDAARAAGQLPAKTGGGAAGFDFSPLDASGNAIAISGGVPASPPACVRDNVTNLIWEVKTAGNMNTTYNLTAAITYAANADTAALCGFNSGWRLPSRRELLSIVHLGASSPAIDSNYFPNTVSDWYWSGSSDALEPDNAWGVHFDDGYAEAYHRNDPSRVRLVRNGL